MPRAKSNHPDSECGPCFFCHQSKRQYYAHPVTWPESLVSQLVEINGNVNKESCICRNCEKDFRNGIGKSDCVPHWRVKDKPLPMCIVSECCNESNCNGITTSICNVETVAATLGIRSGMMTTDSVVLCDEHYKTMHNHIHSNDSMYNPKVKCNACNVAIKGVAMHFRQMSCIQTYYEELGVSI